MSSKLRAEIVKHSFKSSEINEINIKNSIGSIVLEHKSRGPSIEISANKKKFSKKCTYKVEKHQDEIHIEASQKSTSFFDQSEKCELHIKTFLPKNLIIHSQTGSGDIELINTSGEAFVKSGSGNISLKNHSNNITANSGSGYIYAQNVKGHLDLKSGSGEIRLKNSNKNNFYRTSLTSGSGPITLENPSNTTYIKTGSGNTYLKYPNIIKNGLLEVLTGSGNVKVKLPKNFKAKSQVFTGSGNITNHLPNTSHANFSIGIKAGSGDISIRNL